MTSSDSAKKASRTYYQRNRNTQSKVRLDRYHEKKFAIIWEQWLNEWNYIVSENRGRLRKLFRKSL